MLISNLSNKFIVFEGVDGTGKTTLAGQLTKYFRTLSEDGLLYSGSFPGSENRTLGELVYKFHHGQLSHLLNPEEVTAPALQFMHVAAHIHAITTKIVPVLQSGGSVILDRYWWSTYAYSRMHLPAEKVWPLINAERAFLSEIPTPTIIYLSREHTLKPKEVNPVQYRVLQRYYDEIIDVQSEEGVSIHRLDNNSSLISAWTQLLETLRLPYKDMICVHKEL